MDVDTTSQRLQASNILDNFYTTSVILEGELYSIEMQAVDAVGNNHGKLLLTFNTYRNLLKKLAINKKFLLHPKDKLL